MPEISATSLGLNSPVIEGHTIYEPKDEMKKEYDFTGLVGVRGKYHKAYRKGHTVTIHNEDGTITVQHFSPEEGSVMLDSDVRRHFPTSEAVNKALRAIISVIPEKPGKLGSAHK